MKRFIVDVFDCFLTNTYNCLHCIYTWLTWPTLTITHIKNSSWCTAYAWIHYQLLNEHGQMGLQGTLKDRSIREDTLTFLHNNRPMWYGRSHSNSLLWLLYYVHEWNNNTLSRHISIVHGNHDWLHVKHFGGHFHIPFGTLVFKLKGEEGFAASFVNQYIFSWT